MKSVIVWAYEFAADKNYHNFEMEYAMNLQQVSTCLLDKELQFGTVEQIECCMGDIQTKVTIFEHKMNCRGHQRSNLRWLPISKYTS